MKRERGRVTAAAAAQTEIKTHQARVYVCNSLGILVLSASVSFCARNFPSFAPLLSRLALVRHSREISLQARARETSLRGFGFLGQLNDDDNDDADYQDAPNAWNISYSLLQRMCIVFVLFLFVECKRLG